MQNESGWLINVWLLCKSSFRALYATLLLISLKWKLVKLVHSADQIFVGFLGFSFALRGAIFRTFASITDMEWQIIVRLIMVFRSLCKTDCEKVKWAEQIAMERRKIRYEFKES